MDIEKYSERVRGFLQSAQTMALSRNHQQFTPEHLLKVLVDDEEGLAASLISRAGGDIKAVQLGVEAALNALPRVEGGNGQLFLAQPLAKVFSTAEDMAKKVRRFVRHGRAAAHRARRREVGQDSRHPRQGRRDAAGAQPGDQRSAKGPHRRLGVGRAGL